MLHAAENKEIGLDVGLSPYNERNTSHLHQFFFSFDITILVEEEMYQSRLKMKDDLFVFSAN